MYDFIVDICEKIGPRASGTEQEILAGNKIEEGLKKYCEEVHQEGYISSPHAFLGGIRYGAELVSIAIIFYWITLLHDLNFIQLDAVFTIIFLITSICLNYNHCVLFYLRINEILRNFRFSIS